MLSPPPGLVPVAAYVLRVLRATAAEEGWPETELLLMIHDVRYHGLHSPSGPALLNTLWEIRAWRAVLDPLEREGEPKR